MSIEVDGIAEKSDERAEGSSDELSEEYWVDWLVDAAADPVVEDGDSDSVDETSNVEDWASEEFSEKPVDEYWDVDAAAELSALEIAAPDVVTLVEVGKELEEVLEGNTELEEQLIPHTVTAVVRVSVLVLVLVLVTVGLVMVLYVTIVVTMGRVGHGARLSRL
jgi:hypothetical protein